NLCAGPIGKGNGALNQDWITLFASWRGLSPQVGVSRLRPFFEFLLSFRDMRFSRQNRERPYFRGSTPPIVKHLPCAADKARPTAPRVASQPSHASSLVSCVSDHTMSGPQSHGTFPE